MRSPSYTGLARRVLKHRHGHCQTRFHESLAPQRRGGDAQLLEQLHAGSATLCMVPHDPAFAARAGRIVHMLDGRIVDEDTFERLRHERAVPLAVLPEASP